MHPDGFPVPQERDFYWQNIVLSFKTPATDKMTQGCKDDMAEKRAKTMAQIVDRTSPPTLRNNPKAVA